MLKAKHIAKIRKAFNGSEQRVIFKILGDTNRYRIFEMLSKKEKITVSNIAKILEISVPLASQHLKILAQAKILKKEKIGQRIYFELAHTSRITRAIIEGIL